MELINTILGVPLGFVIYFAYQLVGSYGAAILIFAVFVRIMLFPLSVVSHKNSIRLLKLQPSLEIIKRRYAGDRELISERQYKLFKSERYSPLVGLVPLLLQLVLIMGVLQVMYHPMQHLLRLDSAVIAALTESVGVADNLPGGGQMYALNVLLENGELAALADLAENIDMRFLGLNLMETPSLLNPNGYWAVPIAAILAALVFCLVQAAISPGALNQSNRTNHGLTIFTVGMSLYFAFALPVGVGIYWAFGNVISTAVVLILYFLYPPKILAKEAVAYIETTRKTPSDLKAEKARKKAFAAREKADAARFAAAKKRIVFYALSGGQYKFYRDLIEYLLENSEIEIHYLTNDPNDRLFSERPQGLLPYYVSLKKTVSLMLKLDADMVITTVHGLQNFYLKRSVARLDIEYIFIFHGITSTHMVAREAAYDHYDTVFCVGPHHAAELRRREELAGLPKRKLIKSGYGLYDRLAATYTDVPRNGIKILIAPSWQEDNILEKHTEEMLDSLLGNGYNIVVRPHPQFVGLFPERMATLQEKYKKFSESGSGELAFELDISGNESILESDVLITDWSGIAYEFAFVTGKPCVFVDTPMKILNPNYERYGLEITDITWRNKVGISLPVEEIGNIAAAVKRLLSEKEIFREKIAETLAEYIYHPGRSSEAGGRYILAQLKRRAKCKE
ncbi:MAG: membrane protein insertase YidC [Turicibacter sp.]|nr:membrane protein insertase YidC [Turicibacter sp.]